MKLIYNFEWGNKTYKSVEEGSETEGCKKINQSKHRVSHKTVEEKQY